MDSVAERESRAARYRAQNASARRQVQEMLRRMASDATADELARLDSIEAAARAFVALYPMENTDEAESEWDARFENLCHALSADEPG